MRAISSLHIALAMCVAGGLAGCNRSSTTAATDKTYPSDRQPQTTYGYESSRDEKPRDRHKQDKTAQPSSSATMAFPTGDQSTSVLLVSKQMPRQVRAGAPFEYTMTVKNISDQPLEGVVVYDRVPEHMDIKVSQADQARMKETQTQTTQRTTRTVQTERFAVRRYDSNNSPFLPRYTETPEARELTEGEAYAVDRDGRRTAEGETNLGSQGKSEREDGPARIASDDRNETDQPAAERQTVEKSRTTTTREQRDESTDVAATPRQQEIEEDDAFLAGEWFVGHLHPGESRTLTLTGTAPQAGTLATCTTVDYQPTLCLISEVVAPQIKVQRIAPERVDACEPVTITYRVTNTGTGTATGVTVTEQLPEGQTLTDGGSRDVRFNVDNLEQGQTREFKATTRFAQRGQYNGSALVTDSFGSEAQSEQATITAVAPELAIEVTAPEEAYTGRALNYTIKVTNTGDGPARQLKVRQVLPGNARISSASHNGDQQGDAIVWTNLPEIEPNQSLDLNVSLQATSGEGEISSTVTAEALCAKPVSDSVATQLQAVSSLLLEVVDTQDPVPLNSNESYRITVTNQGDKDDTNIQIVVTLPDEMELAGHNATVQPNVQGKTITFTIPRLQPKEEQTIEVSAKALKTGDVRFRVDMTSENLTKPVMETEATRLY